MAEAHIRPYVATLDESSTVLSSVTIHLMREMLQFKGPTLHPSLRSWATQVTEEGSIDTLETSYREAGANWARLQPRLQHVVTKLGVRGGTDMVAMLHSGITTYMGAVHSTMSKLHSSVRTYAATAELKTAQFQNMAAAVPALQQQDRLAVLRRQHFEEIYPALHKATETFANIITKAEERITPALVYDWRLDFVRGRLAMVKSMTRWDSFLASMTTELLHHSRRIAGDFTSNIIQHNIQDAQIVTGPATQAADVANIASRIDALEQGLSEALRKVNAIEQQLSQTVMLTNPEELAKRKALLNQKAAANQEVKAIQTHLLSSRELLARKMDAAQGSKKQTAIQTAKAIPMMMNRFSAHLERLCDMLQKMEEEQERVNDEESIERQRLASEYVRSLQQTTATFRKELAAHCMATIPILLSHIAEFAEHDATAAQLEEWFEKFSVQVSSGSAATDVSWFLKTQRETTRCLRELRLYARTYFVEFCVRKLLYSIAFGSKAIQTMREDRV